MRTLLIQSYTDESEAVIYPIGLASLAAVLAPEHEVRILDLNLHGDPHAAIRREIAAFEPELMGISLRNIKIAQPGRQLTCFETHRAAIQVMRQSAPNVPLLAGGCAFSLFGEITMREIPEIDLGVWGEAEETLPRLMANLDTPGEIRGVYHRTGGETRYTGQPGFPNFMRLPWPRRDLVPIEPYLKDPQSLGIQAKRGCALQCLHCSDTFLSGKRLRMRPAKDVVDEIEYLVESFGAPYVFFCDQVFNIPPTHTQELCQEIIDRKLKVKWTGWFNERGVDRETIRLCKEAGCYQLSFSPDSVDPVVLKKLRKNIKPKDLQHTLDVCLEQKMPVTYNFMINAPGESYRSLWNLLKFIVGARLRMGSLFRLHGLFITTIRIYPHTELELLAMREQMIDSREDLLAPTFYDPASVRWLVHGLLKGLHWAWKANQVRKQVMHQLFGTRRPAEAS